MSAEIGDWLAELCTSEPASRRRSRGGGHGAAWMPTNRRRSPCSARPAPDPVDRRERTRPSLSGHAGSTPARAHGGRRRSRGQARAPSDCSESWTGPSSRIPPCERGWVRRGTGARRQEPRSPRGVSASRPRSTGSGPPRRPPRPCIRPPRQLCGSTLPFWPRETTALSGRSAASPTGPGSLQKRSMTSFRSCTAALATAEEQLQAVATEAYQTLRSVMDAGEA